MCFPLMLQRPTTVCQLLCTVELMDSPWQAALRPSGSFEFLSLTLVFCSFTALNQGWGQ